MADPRYGAALYQYFQGKHLQALSELMVAEARGGIRGHGSNPLLTRGGINLALGMDRRAQAIFESVLNAAREGESPKPPQVRNAAWFYLAQVHYREGDWQAAQESLNQIAGEFEDELLPQLETAAINLAIRNNDLESAQAQLAQQRYSHKQLHYLHFNLANAFSRAARFHEANQHYRQLASLPFSADAAEREEQLALHDRAMTAAGYSQLMQGQHTNAIKQFTQVRLESPWSHQALLGYGWAAAENQDFQLALQPWQVLSERALIHPAVQEARLALPYAYEKLQAPGQALNAYLSAEQDFGRELGRIEAMLADLNSLDILAFAKLQLDEAANPKDASPEGTLASLQSIYLAELFSLDQFQNSLSELQDLLEMKNMLTDWQNRLSAYTAMLDEREKNRGVKLQHIAQQQLADKLQNMQITRNHLHRELERITRERDYLALVNGEESELLDLVRRGETTLARLKAGGEPVHDYEELLQRYRGLLFWQASQDFPDRRWQIESNIQSLDKAIAEAKSNLSRLQGVIADAPDIAPYRRRIETLNQRLLAQTAAVDQALRKAEGGLRDRIAAELSAQKDRLQAYVAQARLSVARLYDRAAQGPLP